MRSRPVVRGDWMERVSLAQSEEQVLPLPPPSGEKVWVVRPIRPPDLTASCTREADL